MRSSILKTASHLQGSRRKEIMSLPYQSSHIFFSKLVTLRKEVYDDNANKTMVSSLDRSHLRLPGSRLPLLPLLLEQQRRLHLRQLLHPDVVALRLWLLLLSADRNRQLHVVDLQLRDSVSPRTGLKNAKLTIIYQWWGG